MSASRPKSSSRTRAIAEAKVKTDKVDSTTLAHLLRSDLVPRAYIPPRAIRDLRELLRYRAALVRLQTGVKNRVHAILLKHGYEAPVTDVFGVKGRRWLATLPLRSVYRQALEGLLAVLDVVQRQIAAASRTIDDEAARPRRRSGSAPSRALAPTARFWCSPRSAT